MSKNSEGSLGYQMMKALQCIFRPGTSRYKAKRYHRDAELITGIGTMRCMLADVHQFARYIRFNWPHVKHLSEIHTEMALAYIRVLEQQERSGGRIGRVCASIRKLDIACRKAGIITADALPLLPYKDQGGPGSFHSEPRPVAYTDEQAQTMIAHIDPSDPAVARLLTFMWTTGLRVCETSYLKANDIDLAQCALSLNMQDNSNRTKGGRPRPVIFAPEHRSFVEQLKQLGEKNPTGHIFHDRRSLPDRARVCVRKACSDLNIPSLGTHGFRKTFAEEDYQKNIQAGASDRQALLKTAQQLGHNRADVTRQSYISPSQRKRSGRRKSG
jgi:integrase